MGKGKATSPLFGLAGLPFKRLNCLIAIGIVAALYCTLGGLSGYRCDNLLRQIYSICSLSLRLCLCLRLLLSHSFAAAPEHD